MAFTLDTVKKANADWQPQKILVYSVQGLGKAQPIDEPVLTPSGWVEIGCLSIGDIVLTPDGGAVPVTGIYPQGVRPVFRVQMFDGGKTRVCREHLWLTRTDINRKKGKPGSIKSTEDIMSTVKTSGALPVTNHSLPQIIGTATSREHCVIPPYILGAWLGDGAKSSASITNPDDGVLERISNELPLGWRLKITNSTDKCRKIYISAKSTEGRGGTDNQSPFIDELRRLGLWGSKSNEIFVPDEYLFSCRYSRLSMLQGLLDTDGWSNDEGGVFFATCSPSLAKDVIDLVLSLGGMSKVSVKKSGYRDVNGDKVHCKPSHTVCISLPHDVDPFSLKRKLERVKPKHQRYLTRYIADVSPDGDADCVCITVDHPDHLYITRDYIVTHNSTFAATFDKPIFVRTEDGAGALDVPTFPSLIATLADMEAAITALHGDHQFKTMVLDSLDWLEPIIYAKQMLAQPYSEKGKKIETIEDYGFGKGYSMALSWWRYIMGGLDSLRFSKGMNIVLIAHSEIKRYDSPDTDPYDRYGIKLHKGAFALWQEWSDMNLFCNYLTRTHAAEVGFNKEVKRGEGSGERVIYTEERPAHLAKNRWGLPPKIHIGQDKTWSAFHAELHKATGERYPLPNQNSEEK